MVTKKKAAKKKAAKKPAPIAAPKIGGPGRSVLIFAPTLKAAREAAREHGLGYCWTHVQQRDHVAGADPRTTDVITVVGYAKDPEMAQAHKDLRDRFLVYGVPFAYT